MPWSFKELVRDALTRVPEISCEELASKLAHGTILDVREHDEIAAGILPDAVVLPRGLVEKHIHEHASDREKPIYVYSSTGQRSALVADVLKKMGYANVYSLAGGFERWRHDSRPVSGGAPAACRIPGVKLDWDEVRKEFAIVQRNVPVLGSGERPLVYLDHAASTHAPHSVLAAFVEFMEREYANVHRGTHLLSRKATERFEEAYYVVADFIGAELRKGCVVFTQNTTHAIDLASHVMADRPGKVITTEMEHHSNELTHRRRGAVLRCRVDDGGDLDLGHLEELLRKNDVKLVACSAGSNISGSMPPIHTIAKLAHENGALILVDAAQAIARNRLDVKPFDHPEHIDFVAAAGHKAYAPFGAGFLYGPRAVLDQAPPYLPGGGTAKAVTSREVEYLPAPDRHHGGTPNIAGIVAMVRAFMFLQQIGIDEIRKHEVALTKRVLDGLHRIGGITVYGPPKAEDRLGVVAFNVDGVSELLAAAVLSEEGGIAVRSGRFCAHIYMDRLLALDAAKKTERDSVMPTGAVRASIGLYNDEHDVDRLLEFVAKVRARKWAGRYRMKGDNMSPELASRCADRWMEATHEGEGVAFGEEVGAPRGYDFEILQPNGGCRSYLIADPETRQAAIVDPLRERVDDYLDLIQSKRYQLLYTIETHTHADHLSGSPRLRDLTGAKMLMHAGSPVMCVDRGLNDGDTIMLGKLQIDVIATPGHTSDSVCLVLPDRVLTGDTLLIGGCGRTDLPSGDSISLYHSLQRLLALSDDTAVFPAHDYDGRRATTIGRERRQNPRLKLAQTEFSDSMKKMNLPTPPNLGEVLQTNQR
ncbi:MAG TPA: aminotransferase class V-fold PLP-dependent enzyme, partial [Xanthomonadales bacterium]|nr:aminotransferase class V-fold PLP-dependent enzyme [Xanthomonadales bacterium]